jgi:hypothetical protein
MAADCSEKLYEDVDNEITLVPKQACIGNDKV